MRYASVSKSGLIRVSFPFNEKLKNQVYEIGGEYDKDKDFYVLPPSVETIEFALSNHFQFSPDDEPRLIKLIDRLETREKQRPFKRALSRALEAEPIDGIQTKIKPFPCQWVPLHYALLQDEVMLLLADDMGVGKSMEAPIIPLHERFQHHPVLIAGPANVVGNWKDELKKLFGIDATIITSPMEELDPNCRFYIISNERLKLLIKKRPDKTRVALPIIRKNNFFLILDEALALKNTKSERYKNIKAIRKWCSHCIMMTGTPMSNRMDELHGLLSILDPHFMSKSAFRLKFEGIKWDKDAGWVYVHDPDPTSLNEVLFDHYMVRRTKLEVHSQLPPKIRQAVSIRKFSLKSKPKNVLDLFVKNAEQKVADNDFCEFVEQITDAADKVLLFAHHSIMLDKLEEICKTNNWKYVRIDGSVPSGEPRQKLVREFQENPDIKVAILSITAAGMGLTLTAANVAIFCEHYWDVATLWQAEDRAHRIGQTQPVLLLNPLITKFDHFLFGLVLEKIGLFEQVINGKTIDSKVETSLFSQIAAEYGIPIK